MLSEKKPIFARPATVEPDDTCESGSFMVEVETPREVTTSFNFKSE